MALRRRYREHVVQTKIVLDREHPCLACGAPWRVRMEKLPANAQGIGWKRGRGDCSARCGTRDMDAYNRALAERAERGWSSL